MAPNSLLRHIFRRSGHSKSNTASSTAQQQEGNAFPTGQKPAASIYLHPHVASTSSSALTLTPIVEETDAVSHDHGRHQQYPRYDLPRTCIPIAPITPTASAIAYPATPTATPTPDINPNPNPKTPTHQSLSTLWPLPATPASSVMPIPLPVTTTPTTTIIAEAKAAIRAHISTLRTTLLLLDALEGFSGTVSSLKEEMVQSVRECEEKLVWFGEVEVEVEVEVAGEREYTG